MLIPKENLRLNISCIEMPLVEIACTQQILMKHQKYPFFSQKGGPNVSLVFYSSPTINNPKHACKLLNIDKVAKAFGWIIVHFFKNNTRIDACCWASIDNNTTKRWSLWLRCGLCQTIIQFYFIATKR